MVANRHLPYEHTLNDSFGAVRVVAERDGFKLVEAVKGQVKLVKHIANLGYGSRKQVQWMFREGRVTDADGEVLYADDQVPHDAIRVDGEPLDPAGAVDRAAQAGRLHLFDQGHRAPDLRPLPPRCDRDPVLSTVGARPRDQRPAAADRRWQPAARIISPKSKLPKVYEVG